MYRIASIIITIVISFAGVLLAAPTGAPPQASNGILNLKDWDFHHIPTIELKGEWRVAWQSLQSPDARVNLTELYPDLVTMPGLWQNETQSASGRSIKTQGYATYALDVILPDDLDATTLGLTVGTGSTSSKWSIYNRETGDLISQTYQGVPAISEDLALAKWVEDYATIGVSRVKHLRIEIQSSNFNYPVAGFLDAPQLGLISEIKREYHSQLIL